MSKKKRTILLITIGILLCIGITIGISYAWWTYTATQEGVNTIQSNCLKIELVDENPITLQNAYPITDIEASFLTPYTFTIKNVCNTSIEYDVNLEIMESKDASGIDNQLASEYIAVEWNGEKKKLLNEFLEVDPTYDKSDYKAEEARYLVSGTLGGNQSETYTIKLWMDEHVTVEDNAMNKNFVSKVAVTASQSHVIRLVDYIINQNEMEEFSHEATYQTNALTDYRYTRKSPNNYVYFGCSEICTNENLYRIIGVIPTQSEIGSEVYENRVKLIKATPYTETESGLCSEGKYQWNTTNNNNWESATLNTQVLNKVYWNNLGEYQNYVAPSVWHLGTTQSQSMGQSYTSNQFYNIERGNKKAYSGGKISTVANIGLLYPSDYGYSIGNQYKIESIYSNREIYKTIAWLYYEENNWSITATSILEYNQYIVAFYRNSEGQIAGSSVTTRSGSIFPTFYLKANVLYENGNGSIEDPFRIIINE